MRSLLNVLGLSFELRRYRMSGGIRGTHDDVKVRRSRPRQIARQRIPGPNDSLKGRIEEEKAREGMLGHVVEVGVDI